MADMRSPIPADTPPEAQALIDRLRLIPHPEEGGFFRETWRADEAISGGGLPARYKGADRSHGTAIYYLLTPQTLSALHRLESNEVFHFYLGDPVEQLMLFPDGHGEVVDYGHDLAAGQQVQGIVPRGVWQGARLKAGGTFALMGCTVAPGFDFADYEHGSRDALVKGWPAHAALIDALTT